MPTAQIRKWQLIGISEVSVPHKKMSAERKLSYRRADHTAVAHEVEVRYIELQSNDYELKFFLYSANTINGRTRIDVLP